MALLFKNTGAAYWKNFLNHGEEKNKKCRHCIYANILAIMESNFAQRIWVTNEKEMKIQGSHLRSKNQCVFRE